jgi:hypothetical protein
VVTNAGDDDVGVLKDQPVREAEDGAAKECEPVVACDVAGGAREVGRAIGFEDHRSLDAEEVDEESPERVLPAELHATERATAQQLP